MFKKIWYWLWRGIALLMVLVLAYEAWFFVQVWWYVDHNPGTTAFMERRLALLQEKMGEDAALKHRWVPYEKISINLKRALIAAEDSKFLTHEGFDIEGIEKAPDAFEGTQIARRRVWACG